MEIKNFVNDWVNNGNQSNDTYNKFFAYFVALNFLYNHEFENISSERERLALFVAKMISDNKFRDFKITLDNNSELTKRQILDMRAGKPSKLYKLEDIKNGNIVSIFLMIYQIRCNLFHGGKELYCDRDKNLVNDANCILKQFLEKYLELTNE